MAEKTQGRVTRSQRHVRIDDKSPNAPVRARNYHTTATPTTRRTSNASPANILEDASTICLSSDESAPEKGAQRSNTRRRAKTSSTNIPEGATFIDLTSDDGLSLEGAGRRVNEEDSLPGPYVVASRAARLELDTFPAAAKRPLPDQRHLPTNIPDVANSYNHRPKRMRTKPFPRDGLSRCVREHGAAGGLYILNGCKSICCAACFEASHFANLIRCSNHLDMGPQQVHPLRNADLECMHCMESATSTKLLDVPCGHALCPDCFTDILGSEKLIERFYQPDRVSRPILPTVSFASRFSHIPGIIELDAAFPLRTAQSAKPKEEPTVYQCVACWLDRPNPLPPSVQAIRASVLDDHRPPGPVTPGEGV